jgi:hypothetical protein
MHAKKTCMGRKIGAVQSASGFIAQLCQDPQQFEQLRQFIQRRLFSHRHNPGAGRIFSSPTRTTSSTMP